jgi:hypothetical protein
VVLWFICTQPEPGKVVMSSKPSLMGAQDDTGVEVGVTGGGVVAVGVDVAVAVGVVAGVAPVIVILPAGCVGVWPLRSASIKKKFAGSGCQVKAVV